jgi:peptide/nickel transport system permease protein
LLAFVFRRVLGAIPLLLGVATLVFVIMSLVPGDPAGILFPIGTPPEVIAEVRRQWGLDDPFLLRYGKWLLSFVQGDFGYSHFHGMWVRDRILLSLPYTLALTSLALVLTFLVGMGVGILQAVKQGSYLDSALSGITLFFYSMPSFWLALMLMLVFSSGPLSLPASGAATAGADFPGGWAQILDRLKYLILPVLTLTLVLSGGVARYVRTSMLEVIRQDYMRTARAKGLPESRVILKHGLRNGLIPVVTLLGVYLPFLLSGAVLVEKVFAYPGMGSLMVDAIGSRDYPMVLAGTFLFGAMVVLGNLLADLLYGMVDPRIRVKNG